MSEQDDSVLLYNPNGDTLRQLYPDVAVDDTIKSGMRKEKKVDHNNLKPYLEIKNINYGKDDFESIEPVVGIGLCVSGKF